MFSSRFLFNSLIPVLSFRMKTTAAEVSLPVIHITWPCVYLRLFWAELNKWDITWTRAEVILIICLYETFSWRHQQHLLLTHERGVAFRGLYLTLYHVSSWESLMMKPGAGKLPAGSAVCCLVVEQLCFGVSYRRTAMTCGLVGICITHSIRQWNIQ